LFCHRSQHLGNVNEPAKQRWWLLSLPPPHLETSAATTAAMNTSAAIATAIAPPTG